MNRGLRILAALSLGLAVTLCGAWRWNPADRAKANAANTVVATAEAAAATATNAQITAQAAATTATNAAATAQASATTATNASAAAQAAETVTTNALAAGKSFVLYYITTNSLTGTLYFASGLATNTP